MKCVSRVLLCCLLWISLAAAGGAVCFAQETPLYEPQTVRVGWYLSAGTQQEDAEGLRSGYCYDYYQEIARYGGLQYEYVPGTWNECLQRLAQGEIDVLSYVQYTPERDKLYDFTPTPMGQSYAILTTLADNEQVKENNYSSFQGKTVGALRAAVQIEQFYRLMEQQDFWCNVVEYDTNGEMVEALENGTVDMMLGSSFRRLTENERVVAQFHPTPVYFAVKQGNTALLEKLEYALCSLRIYDGNLETRLMQKYFSSNARKALVLTEEEQAFLKNAGTLRFLGITAPGLSGVDKEGTPQGFLSALLQVLSQEIGFSYTYQEMSSFDALETAIGEGNFDVICNFTYDYAWAEKGNVTLSTPYLTLPYYLIQSKSASQQRKVPTVAVPVGLRYGEALQSQPYNPDQMVWYESERECLDAVASGQQTVAYCSTYGADYYLSDYAYRQLSSTLTSMQKQLCFGASTKHAAVMASILSKGIACLGTETVNKLATDNLLYRRVAPTLQSLLAEYPTQSVLVISVVLAVIAGLLLLLTVANYRLRRTRTQLEMRSQEYRMAAKNFTDHLFQIDLERHILYLEQADPVLGLPAVVENLPDGLLELPFLEETSREAFRQAYIQLCQGAGSAHTELYCTTRAGEDACYNLTLIRVARTDKKQWAIGTLEDIYQQRQRERYLSLKAETDTVTGLLNRGAAEEYICDALQRGVGGLLLLFDVDNFKHINDTMGHGEGDRVLHNFAQVLRKCFRSTDIVGRLGGDEFIALLPDAEISATMLEKASYALQQAITLRQGLPEGVAVSVSLGIAAAPQHGTDFTTLYKAADIALYEAKRRGKNCFAIYEPGMEMCLGTGQSNATL